MRVGLIDVDGHNFPNIPLMKLSAWHKQQGDSVGWYIPTEHGFPLPPMDRVYMSKVFASTPGYPYYVNAKRCQRVGADTASGLKMGRKCTIRRMMPSSPMGLNIYTRIIVYTPNLQKIPHMGL